MSINSFSDEDREILKGIIGTGDEQPGDGDKADEQAATPAATAETPPADEKVEAKPAQDAAPEKKGDPHRASLRASRRSEEKAIERAERAERELAELRAAQPKAPKDDDITDEELAALEGDFPLVAKAVRVVKASKTATPQAKPADEPPPDPEFMPRKFAAETQELLDGNDDALAWQNDPDQLKFDLLDTTVATLLRLPKFKGQLSAELIDEAVRRVHRELQVDEPPAPKPKQRKDPEQELNNAALRGPRSISDVPGASGANDDQAARSARFNRMSDEDILQELALGG